MARLETFDIWIKTGKRGRTDIPRFCINGFDLDFEQYSGGAGSGETFEATGAPGSFAHTLLLDGPSEGEWDIEKMTITYYPDGEEPYTVRFGSVTLDAQSDLNIAQQRPLETFDV